MLGSWNFVEKFVPAARPIAKEPTRATSHTARTIQRWREHHLAIAFTS